jgi:hypothetical protein
LLTVTIVYSQNLQVEFTYDNAGNRTSRQIVSLNKSTYLSDTISILEDHLEGRTVKLYPNPTYGLLTMEISSLKADEKVMVLVTDMNGHILLKEAQTTSSFKIDLTSRSKGFYILSATIGNERREWKIIKE